MSWNTRIESECAEMRTSAPDNCSAGPTETDLGKWTGTIIGPVGTPYEGGMFYLSIAFPQSYPFVPPLVRFTTRIYHCNIAPSGEICLDILKEQWSPALTIAKVLLSICSLMSEPNPDDPLVPAIAELLRRNPPEHDRRAREYTDIYAG